MADFQGTIVQKNYGVLEKKFKAAVAARDAEIERLKAIIAKLENKKPQERRGLPDV